MEVGSFHGGARAVDIWDIAICTIEKVDFLASLLTVGKFIDQFDVGGEYDRSTWSSDS